MAKKSIPADRIDIETKLLRARAIFDLIGSTGEDIELDKNTLGSVVEIGREYIDAAIRHIVDLGADRLWQVGEVERIKGELNVYKAGAVAHKGAQQP